ncbi:MAG: ATP-binding protein [Sphingobacteriia bacterium]|nr:ATP-binding protein [Sphingobacteriia bacterium]
MKDIALHILDIIHNSIRAKASEVSLSITENPAQDDYILMISDNGNGIPADMLPQVTDPFTTSRKTRKVGMGLALLSQNAEQSGGNIEISSTPTSGTTVKCRFGFHHLDRLPAGDIPGVIVQLITAFPAIRFLYHHQTPSGSFKLDTCEIRETLGKIPVNDPEVRKFLFEMIAENLKAISAER